MSRWICKNLFSKVDKKPIRSQRRRSDLRLRQRKLKRNSTETCSRWRSITNLWQFMRNLHGIRREIHQRLEKTTSKKHTGICGKMQKKVSIVDAWGCWQCSIERDCDCDVRCLWREVIFSLQANVDDTNATRRNNCCFYWPIELDSHFYQHMYKLQVKWSMIEKSGWWFNMWSGIEAIYIVNIVMEKQTQL